MKHAHGVTVLLTAESYQILSGTESLGTTGPLSSVSPGGQLVAEDRSAELLERLSAQQLPGAIRGSCVVVLGSAKPSVTFAEAHAGRGPDARCQGACPDLAREEPRRRALSFGFTSLSISSDRDARKRW